MNKCFCCGYEVIWDNDFNYDDLGYNGNGIVRLYHCPNCGSDIEYRIPLNEEEDD